MSMITLSAEKIDVSNGAVTMEKDEVVKSPPQACPICPICPICSAAVLCPYSTTATTTTTDAPFTTVPLGQLQKFFVECIIANRFAATNIVVVHPAKDGNILLFV